MKKKNLIIIFVILILTQIVFLILSENQNSIGYESKKAFEEFEKEHPGVIERIQNSSDKKTQDELVTEIAKRIFIEEANRRLKDSKIRNFMSTLDNKDKELLIQEPFIEMSKLKETNPNSYKIIESEHEIEIMKNGYNPITFIMEKVLNLNSYDFLKNQNNYFFILITIILFLVFLTVSFLKSKTKT